MKFLLNATLSAAVIAVPLSTGAIAQRGFAATQNSDYICFMTTPSGKVVDLSKSMCANKTDQPDVIANSDEAFIEAYKQNAMGYPDVSDNLLANLQQSPEVSITQAKKICNDLKAGMSFEEIKNQQAEQTVERASFVNATIINNLATKYYCSGFKPE